MRRLCAHDLRIVTTGIGEWVPLMVNLNKGLAGRSENSVVARDVGRAIAPLRAAG
jgi:hypothetical protein